MHKFPLLALSILALAGLLSVAPALAVEAPSSSPALCLTNASTMPAVGAPAPLPAFFNFQCGVCSDANCHNKKAGDACGVGPQYLGYHCNNPSRCAQDGLYTCSCEIT